MVSVLSSGWGNRVWFVGQNGLVYYQGTRGKVLGEEGSVCRAQDLSCGMPGVSEQPLFPCYLQLADLAGGAVVRPMRFLGPSAAEEPFWAGKILNSVWSNNLLSAQRSTEMLRGCWERKKRGFLHPPDYPEELGFLCHRWRVYLKEQNLPLKVLLLKKFNHNLKNAAHDLAECNLFTSKRWSTHANLGERYIFPFISFWVLMNHLKKLWRIIKYKV